MGKHKTNGLTVSNSVPADIINIEYTGFENVDNDSISIPFLKIAQNTSAQINEDDPSYIRGLKPGMFYNSITGKNYGRELNVVALGYYRLFMEWEEGRSAPVQSYTLEEINGMGMEIKRDGLKLESQTGNRIVDTRYFFVSLPDYPNEGIILFALASTGITHSKKWLTKASMITNEEGKQYPLFASIWKLKTALNANDFGKWYALGNKKSTLINHVGFITKNMVSNIKAQLNIVKDYLKNVHAISYAEVEDEEIDDTEM